MSTSGHKRLNIVSITACQAGIAHTYLCAEALSDSAKEFGHKIKIETRGSIGAENILTEEDIAKADLVFLAVEININKDRFEGKPVYETGTHEVAVDSNKVLKRAIKWLDEEYNTAKDKESVDEKIDEVALTEKVEETKKSSSDKKKEHKIADDLYRHFMAGFSYILPFVVISGIFQGLATALVDAGYFPQLIKVLELIGNNAFIMMGPIMTTYMAFSIADRPGIVPGMMVGLLTNVDGSGFIGAILGGFVAGYITLFMKNKIKFKSVLQAMVPILILPLLSTLVACLFMTFVVSGPSIWVNDFLTVWLQGLTDGGIIAILIGALLGWMITGDFGGILCRASFAFGVSSLAAGPSLAMAATMAGGLVTGWSLSFATLLWPKKFTAKERELGKSGWINGMSFVVESGIPFAARDPKVQYVAHGVGGAIAGGLVAAFHCTQNVAHGGMWVMVIPGVFTNLPKYLIAVAAGIVFATLYMGIFKKNVKE
jgi:PTS system fructose-specific IIC component